MKRILFIAVAALFSQYAHSQIIITSADMPVHGDQLCYSNATAIGAAINPGDSGANITWNYTLTSTSQGVDTYKLAYQVNPAFAGSISLSAIGYKIADSIPGLSTLIGAVSMLPISVSITNIHTYFQQITIPAAYMASAMSYNVESIITMPTAANYSDPDVWYFFPLTYGNATDSAHYRLHMSLLSFASIEQEGYRKTRVDGYGTITTPYFTTPVNCIRVRSVIHEIDSISVSGNKFGFPRDMVEYKWLVNGEHYPALWVTSTVAGGMETVTTVRYRDVLDPTRVVNETAAIYPDIKAFPNPTANGIVTLGLPTDWKTFQVEVFDVNAKVVATVKNTREINLGSFVSGQYFIRITSGSNVGYTTVTKQ